jgi:phage-related protein
MFADNLSQSEYKKLRTWLKPRNVGKLILSDQPYKYYIVKVTSIGTLGEYPLTDAQHIDHSSMLGDSKEGNVVYVGKFTVTFQTVGSSYGYGLSYYRDDLVYDALNKYGVGVYPDNYYYDSGLLYKDMAPALTRMVPSNAKNFDLTIYNPGSATAIPTIHVASNEKYGDKAFIQLDNNSLNTSTVIDLQGLQGPLIIDCETETVITKTIKDGKEVDVYNYGRFQGNIFEIGEETSVLTLPESYTETIEDFYFKDYDTIYITHEKSGTWANINPLVLKVNEDLIGQYFCINGNGGARIIDIDDKDNCPKLDDSVITYEILPAGVKEDGTPRPGGMEFNYIGDFASFEKLPQDSKPGDVASVTIMKTTSKGATVVDRIDMYLYRYNKWSITSLFTDPKEFENYMGQIESRYLIFGANIVDVNDIKISTNIGECEVSISFLPRYL